MGVGYPVDIIVSACLGVDMFDCVFSTRTARFGTAFSDHGFLKLKNKESEAQFIPIQEGCECQTCKRFTRSFLHFTVAKEETSCHLVSVHNLHWLINLMLKMHKAIVDGELP
jgi:queuine tRNA-ribosyltransferase catalytic subunit